MFRKKRIRASWKGPFRVTTMALFLGATPVSSSESARWVCPIPEKAPVVVEMFERYATGAYSDMQIAEWLNGQGFRTNRDHPFGKDAVRDMLCNAYYVGMIRYRGMTVRPKGVSFRSTPPQVSEGQHEPIISEELWQRSQAMRASRRATVKTIKKTVRVNLLQGLVVCANCGRRLTYPNPKELPDILPGRVSPSRLSRLSLHRAECARRPDR